MELQAIGIAASKANLPPTYAVMIFNNLLSALDQGLVLSSRFHLLCVIVPLDIELISCNFNLFNDEYRMLSQAEKELLAKWSITEDWIFNATFNPVKLVRIKKRVCF